MTTTLGVISEFLGWAYFAAWALSSYPQLIRNFRRRSVQGYSLEFQLWNMTGFTFYLIYTVVGYQQQHSIPNLKHSITINDIAFAVHAFFMNVALSTQCLVWGKNNKEGISRMHVTMVGGLWLIAVYNVFLGGAGFLPWFSHSSSAYAFSVIQFLGFGKSFVSFVKYTPQVYLNWKRKSTAGWSITNTLLDFAGGALSFAQMVVIAFDRADANGNADWSQVSSNIPKVILAVESMMFDVIMMVQHYILYGEREVPSDNDTLTSLASHGSSDAFDAPLFSSGYLSDGTGASGLGGGQGTTIQHDSYVEFDK